MQKIRAPGKTKMPLKRKPINFNLSFKCLFLLVILVNGLTTTDVVAQKSDFTNFIKDYDQLRYSLYPKLNKENPVNLDKSTAIELKTFLESNNDIIVAYRNNILNKYLRNGIENTNSNLFEIDDSLKQNVQSSHVFLGMLNEANTKGEAYEDVYTLLKFLSVDPLVIVNSICSHIQSVVFMNTRNSNSYEIARLYTQSFIGGRYISTEKFDKANWLIRVNEYYYLALFEFNAVSGKIILNKIYRRSD